MLSYYLLKAIGCLACLLPRRLADAVGWGIGHLAWPLVPRRRRRLAEGNVQRCLACSEGEAQRIAKASAVRFGPMLMEVLRFPVIERHIGDYVAIEGLSYLQEALAAGKGGIIATAHSGNWELMGGAFALAGIPLVGVAQKQRSKGADRFIVERRTQIGMHITYKTGVREMFDMLSEGWFIGLIMDQDPSKRDGMLVEFFDQPTNYLTGAAGMSRFRGAPIFPAFMHRDDATGASYAHRLAADLHAAHEGQARRHPAHDAAARCPHGGAHPPLPGGVVLAARPLEIHPRELSAEELAAFEAKRKKEETADAERFLKKIPFPARQRDWKRDFLVCDIFLCPGAARHDVKCTKSVARKITTASTIVTRLPRSTRSAARSLRSAWRRA